MKSDNESTQSTGDDKWGERIVERLFPNLRIFAPKFLKLVNDFDPATPQTSLAKLDRILSGMTPSTPASQRFILRFIKAATRVPRFRQNILDQLDEVITMTKTEAKKDSRYSLLLKLMHDADKKTVLAGGVVTFRHADPSQWFAVQMNSKSKIDRAKSAVGELRANAAKDAFRDTVEYLYTPYIKTLVYLSLLREGRDEESLKKVEGMRFGNAIKYLSAKLSDYLKLFDDRAGWMRNCATHDYVPFDLPTDSSIFRDREKNPIPISTDDLLALTEDMYQLAGETVARVGQLYMFREVFRNMGLRDILLDHIPVIAFEKDPQKAQGLEEKMRKDLEAKFKTGH
ncbi:MAG TPA: hypothetical protein PKC65_01895 [Pyrinomonadaceae bacterium]|nr:hypothetical protein [Pyrinomonadaceae bacterium]